MSENPAIFHTAVPSEWYSFDKLDTGTHKQLLLWDLYSVIGTPLDIEYAKKTLSELYSEVVEHIPESYVLDGAGIINFSNEKPSFDEYIDEQIVMEKQYCFGLQPNNPPTIKRTVSEIKIKCRN
jgi:hypothetical protein